MQNQGFRHRLRERLNRFRRKSRNSLDDGNIHLPQSTQQDPDLATSTASISQYVTSTAGSLPSNQTNDAPRECANTGDDEAQNQTHQMAPGTTRLDQRLTTDPSTVEDDMAGVVISSDLWSTAYREAVESLGEEIDVAILKGRNVEQLFRELEEIDKEATQESVFLKGVKYLQSIQVPLERFKLALDLASPLTSLEPTASTVFGVVRSVTAIAIIFSTADLEFAKQIGEMLEQIAYIDDCDTLGQKADKEDIHKALVLVYQKLLEFYKVAFEILTRKGAKLVMRLILENGRLPSIVQDFLRHADTLRKLVQKATWEIVEDIKAMLYDQEIGRWLGSDKMSRQSQYHASLQDLRADQACEFLLTNPKFIHWDCASDSQQLVVLGDMGCGKTVAMAFLVDELRRRSEHRLPQPKVCYYYCRDDETGHAIQIFSGLILSLLEQLPGLKKRFFEWYKQAQASGNFEPAKSTKKLEEFLQGVLEAIDRPVYLVIDGLDECDRASRNILLKSLRTLSQKIPRLKAVLSSRPREEILQQLNEMARIDLVSDAKRDGIIVEQTVERQLLHLSKDVKVLIIERLSRLAQGRAIWTKMIIELIEVRGITALGPMRRFLEDVRLPEQLTKLYVTLFSRCTSNEPENQELASTALKLLAIARRPLSILELAWAVALGTAQQDVTKVAALGDLVDHQRVMSLIHPFIARVDFSDVKKRQVQLIHQSVKEFIRDELTLNQSFLQTPATSNAADQASPHQRIKSLEAFILDICIKYLRLDDIDIANLFSEEQVAIEELPHDLDLFDDDREAPEYDPCCTWEAWEQDMIRYDPADRGFGEFFIYASCHWLDHFGAITVEPLPSLSSIENLCQAGSTRLDNWIEQNRRPDCAIKPRFEFDSGLYDPLSITSLYGSEAMLRDMLENSDFGEDKFLPNPALGAADQILQWGDLSRLRILLESNLGYQLQSFAFFRLVIGRWSAPGTRCNDWDLAFDLVDCVLDILVREQWGNELLCMAAGAGCIPIVRRLMMKAQQDTELRSELLRGSRCEQQLPFGKLMHQSIGEAVLGNHVDVVEYLLEENGIEAHLQFRNSRGENVLHLASRHCNPAMFRLLVPRFQEGIQQTDDQGDTALVRIIMSSSSSRGRYGSASTLLLQDGANWDSQSCDEQQDPLRIAVRLGDLDMCHLLVRIGKMNPLSAMARDDDGQMILKDETPENANNMLEILQFLRANIASTSAP